MLNKKGIKRFFRKAKLYYMFNQIFILTRKFKEKLDSVFYIEKDKKMNTKM